MHRGGLVACVVAVSACSGEVIAPAAPQRDSVDSLWELAPHDASSGVVLTDGTPAKVLALIAMLGDGPARRKLDEAAKKHDVEPLPTAAGWASAGLDPALGAAAFAWTDRERGALLVLPVRDRAAFRRAFKGSAIAALGRTFDEFRDGYVCGPASGRYVCATRAEDIVAAGTRHGSPLAKAQRALPAEDRGDIEAYADVHVREVAQLAEDAKPLGRITGVASAIKLRLDGIGGRVHIIADELTPLAYALRGSPPPASFRMAAARAPTVAHFSIDPKHMFESGRDVDAELRAEFLDRFTGEVDMTTSGHGLAGLYGVAGLSDARRAEAFLKKSCAAQGGSDREYALRDITVTEHGCSARFDPHMLLLPVSMSPLPVACAVLGDRFVFTVGDATPPVRDVPRAEAFAPEGTDEARALSAPAAAIAFTRTPWIGPDVGAGAAFKSLVSLLDEKSTTGIDAFGDVGARIAQAMLAARVEETGLVVVAELVTFARDPEPASAAYDAALARRSAGEIGAYRAALADVELHYPGTLAAQRVRDLREQGPWLGAGVTFLGSLGSF